MSDPLRDRLQQLADEGYNLTRPYGDPCDKCGTKYLESGINLAYLLREVDDQ